MRFLYSSPPSDHQVILHEGPGITSHPTHDLTHVQDFPSLTCKNIFMRHLRVPPVDRVDRRPSNSLRDLDCWQKVGRHGDRDKSAFNLFKKDQQQQQQQQYTQYYIQYATTTKQPHMITGGMRAELGCWFG